MMKKQSSRDFTRRDFIKSSAITAVGLAGINNLSYSRILGANEKIRVGFIGVGNRGSQLLNMFMKNSDVEVAALCDIYEPYLNRDFSKVDPRYVKNLGSYVPRLNETLGQNVKRFSDFRKLLEQKDIDAVCIATPEHWHAIITIQAIKAGKDVYVEKPLSITIREGRMMVNAQAASKQVVAVGINRRGIPMYQRLAKEIPAGKIGKVTVASAGWIGNMFPHGIGKLKPEAPPKDFNWDMWLGPRAFRPYQYNLAPYYFRWWDGYSSQVANQGVHFLDLLRWMLGETGPVAISSVGGKYAVDDDRTIPDTLQVTYEFASGKILTFCTYEASSGNQFPYGFLELRGTKGTLYGSATGYHIIPTVKGQFQTWNKQMDAVEYETPASELPRDGANPSEADAIIRNFLDCIKSRQTPWVSLEDGHRSTSLALLANISLATRERLHWDPVKERFTNSEKANGLLHYEYRKPWTL